MAHHRTKATRRPRRHAPHPWYTSRLAHLTAAAAVCALVVLFAWGAASAAGEQADPKGPSVTDFTKHPWCGEAGQQACPAPNPGWIAVSAGVPGAVATAIAQSDVFRMINAQHGGVALDLPTLVHTMATPSGYDYYDDDHWVVAVRDGKNQQVGLYDFVYDQANSRIRFASYGALTPKDARFGHAFPLIPASAAATRLQDERHLGQKAGTQPQLVFFPLDDRAIGPQATIHWSAGGGSPLDAMWRVTGADGVPYFVGQDTHVYDLRALPIRAAQP